MIGVHQACQLCGSVPVAVDNLDSVVVLLVGSLEGAVAAVDRISLRWILQLWLGSSRVELTILAIVTLIAATSDSQVAVEMN